jgi:membrane protein implicated in regulation of membrane protease activity
MTTFWLFLGLGLCALEAVFPTAFIALVMGASALVMAMLSPWILSSGLQALVWIALSGLGVLLSRSFVKPAAAAKRWDDAWGEVTEAIDPGQTGRVRYEGGSWLACGETTDMAVEAGQTVQILSKRGTMLVVKPADGVAPRQPIESV